MSDESGEHFPLPAGRETAYEIDTTTAHSPRIWNYWLGGKDYYPVDREVGDQISRIYPYIVQAARAERAFLGRVVRHLASEAGIDQFLDIGTGLPTVDNTHEVAQRLSPRSRIVYVDNDPLVLTHARALLTSTPEGATDYIQADLRDPDTILREAARTLDLTRPVALMLLEVLHFVLDDDQAQAIIDRLLDAVPPGSYLVIAHGTNQVHGAATDDAIRHWNEFSNPPMTLRTPDQIARFFDRLRVLDPGVVSCNRWRPESDDSTAAIDVDAMCCVGRYVDH